ncbi:FtsW/RodA/SpoVE family cell division protein [Fictibacillus macauensis ZFHKF-1]|uniref:FtsW/RodA/SpoVE family cell division protein n=1 Tax=Fictibacillus macauensis ZFHKF-1 TaxID=1196324 RepID=I8J3Z2_9BACL|nr:FtsW/RodA/SpoVE family cell division protein [Fictibacillus macauensis ZFHKF-1]
MQEIKEFFSKLDYGLLFFLFLFSIISCLFVFSGQQTGQYEANFVPKQIGWYVFSILLMLAVAFLDFDQLKRLSWYIFGFVLVFIIILRFSPESIAKPINGSKAWFQLPLLGSFQPSEFMKIAFIILLSNMAEKHNERYIARTISSDFRLIGKMTLVCLVPFIFVYIQPDTGMIMLYLAIIIPILITSGISWKIIAAVAALPTIILSTLLVLYFKYNDFFESQLLSLVQNHQRERINGWLKPYEYVNEGYQTKQAITAIGSGMVSGKGWTEGNMYVPEAHTDFIFSMIGEDLGFVGTAAVVTLYFILMYKIIGIAHGSKNSFGGYMCAGIVGVLSFQAFQNIGMNIGLLPVTGVTLPFLSYGGSSLLSNMILMGLVVGVKVQTRKFMFEVNDLKM